MLRSLSAAVLAAALLPSGAQASERIAFSRFTSDFGGHSALFRMALGATAVHRLTPWRLDADIGEASSVATVPEDCGAPRGCARQIRYVTHNPPDGRVNSTNPSWSPDGTRIVMAEWTNPSTDAADDGVFDGLYTLDLDGGAKTLITSAERWSMRPSWGPAS